MTWCGQEARLILVKDLGPRLTPKGAFSMKLAVLRHLLKMVKEWLDKAREWNRRADSWSGGVPYTSVPIWKPWRDL